MAGEPNAKASSRNLSIEGLRGLAAYVVIISHINGMATARGFAPEWQRVLDRQILTHLGAFGVCAFFCISGYLIVQSLMKYRDVGIFAYNRAKRIYPLFLVLTLVAFPYSLLAMPEFQEMRGNPLEVLMHLISNLLFLPGVFALPIAQDNAWSLSFEAIFYVTSCLLFLGLHGKSTFSRFANGAAGLGIAGSMLFFRPYAWFFLVGALVYWLQVRRPEAPKWVAAAPVGLVAMIAAYVSLPEGWRFVPPTPAYAISDKLAVTDAERWAYALQTLYLWPLVLAFSFAFFATLVYERGWLSKMLQHRGIVYLGTISYSLYLVHPFVLHGWLIVNKRLPDGIQPYAFILVGATVPIVVAHYCYRWFEVWLTKRLFPSRKPTNAPAVTS